jgi:hypothetical protein
LRLSKPRKSETTRLPRDSRSICQAQALAPPLSPPTLRASHLHPRTHPYIPLKNIHMSEVKDESDFDMLFDDSPDISDNQDVISSVGPQLSRQNQHSGVITQIEAVFETVADALLNERADVTISLASISSNEPRDISVKTPKAVFTFPGKTANDAWRFCR